MAYVKKTVGKRKTSYKAEVAYPDGSKKSKSFRTKAEAEAWGRSQEDQKHVAVSSGVSRVRITLNEYFDKWFAEYALLHHSPGWRISELQMYRDYVKPVIGNLMLPEIRPYDVQRCLNAARKDRSPSSVNRIRQMLSKMFNEALLTYRYIVANPVLSVKRFKEDPKVMKHLSRDEATLLIEWSKNHPFGIAFELALQLGLREGELVGLKWDAIDLERRELIVRRKWEKKTKQLEEFPKGKKIRFMGIYPDGLLESLKAQRLKFRDADFVVCKSDGSRVEADHLIRALDLAVRETGITRITMHGLRHTYASIYMQSGGSLYDLQKLMGHSCVSTTERYRHTDIEHMRRVSDMFDLYVDSAKTPPNSPKPTLRVIQGGDGDDCKSLIDKENRGGEGEIRTLETR